MRIFRLSTAVIAASALYALSASAQTTTTPSKQPTQGLPPSMTSPRYGGHDNAQKQKIQGLPRGVANPQYGGTAVKQKASGIPASLVGGGQYGSAQKQP